MKAKRKRLFFKQRCNCGAVGRSLGTRYVDGHGNTLIKPLRYFHCRKCQSRWKAKLCKRPKQRKVIPAFAT